MAMRPRRSVLYLPGDNDRALEKAKGLPADSIIIDLEDSVAPANKEKARAQATAAIHERGFGSREVVLRVNPIETEDCAAISMRTAEGALVTSSITLGAAGNASRFRATFEHVTLTSSTNPYQIGAGPWTFEASDPARQAVIDAVVASVAEIPHRFAGQFSDMHARLTGGADLYLPSLEEGYHSVELMTAIYASARNGQVVSLPLRADHPLSDGWLLAGAEVGG